MISSEHELAATLKKLAILEADMANLDATEEHSAVRQSCRLSLARLINQFKEEIDRYRWGRREKVFLQRALQTQEEADNTRRKLAELEELIQTRKREMSGPVARLSLSSMRRTRNKLKEQVLWFEAKQRERVHA
jgi:hypothetical protein